ncbi:MAG: hypothetical protein AAF490_05255 [Chloroflexota bacterium]
MSDQRFKEAVTLIKAGDIEKGQKILLRIVRDNPLNEKAWLWLVNTTPKPANQIGCLEKVLRINPNHKTAQKLISELRAAQAQANQTVDSDMGFEYMGSPAVETKTHQNGTAPYAVPADIVTEDEDDDDDGFIYTGEFISVPSFEEEDEDKTEEVLQDPLMLQIEMERKKMAQEAAKKGDTNKIVAQESSGEKIKTAPKKTSVVAPPVQNGYTKPVGEPIQMNDDQLEIRIPEKVYEYSVSMVISKAKGAFGFLFSGKNQLTKSLLKIAPEVGLLQIKGIDALVQNEQHNLYFADIIEIECLGPSLMTFVLNDGKSIQLKDVFQAKEIIEILETKIKINKQGLLDSDVHQLTKTPDQFETSLGQSM